jgi:hypothetical protein
MDYRVAGKSLVLACKTRVGAFFCGQIVAEIPFSHGQDTYAMRGHCPRKIFPYFWAEFIKTVASSSFGNHQLRGRDCLSFVIGTLSKGNV